MPSIMLRSIARLISRSNRSRKNRKIRQQGIHYSQLTSKINPKSRSEAGIGARKGGAPKNPEKALKKNKKKAEKAGKKADKKAKKQKKKKESQGKHPVTTKIPKKEFEFSDLDMNVVSIEGTEINYVTISQ